MRVYIDGENFRHSIANILVSEGLIISNDQMLSYPVRILLTDVLAEQKLDISYYASRIKLPRNYEPSPSTLKRAEEIKAYNRKWIAQLVNQGVEHIKAGYLKVKAGEACAKCGNQTEVLQEKGVDVRLAVDITSDMSRSKQQQKIVLLSSDSDLIPAIDRARKHGHYVVYVCFGETVNRAMSAASNETVAIPRLKVLKYYGGA